MAVRSQLPWPLRWAVLAVMLGFSAAIALWAFEFGREIAGLDRGAQDERQHLRDEVLRLREQLDRAQSIANTAESLLKTERTAQERLAAQLKQLESDNLALKADLGFYERLLPAPAQGGSKGVAVRGFLAEADGKGHVRYQLLVMRQGRPAGVFAARYEVTLAGTLDGKPWSLVQAGGPRPLELRQSARVEGRIDHPVQAVVKTVEVRVTQADGALLASETARL